MRRLTASVLSTVLIAPAVVLAPTVSLPRLAGALAAGGPARPKPVEPVVTSLPLTATPAAPSASSGDESGLARGAGDRPAVLTGTLSTREFETLAVTWDLPTRTAPSITVSARVHGDEGWGDWFALALDDVNATAADVDGSTAGYRGGTEPYWAGDSDGVQVRVDLHAGRLPTGLRVELIDPGRSAYDAVVGAPTPGGAEAAPTRPTIYSRATWGADERKVRDRPTIMPTVKAAVIHHTAGANGYSRSSVPKILRSTYAYHLSRGWDDIGYNFLVDRFGRIWEGRGGGITKAVQGAHTGGFNEYTFGVSMMGNYDGGTKPTAAALDAVARLIAWKLDLFRVDPKGKVRLTSSGGGTSRYAAGKKVTLPTVFAHRDVGYTACPGRNVFSQMSSVRAKVAAYTQAQLVGVRQNTGSVAFGASGPTVSFSPMATQSWKLSVKDACRGSVVGSASGTAARGDAVAARWNGRISGKPARAGTYLTSVTSASQAGSARPFAGRVVISPPRNQAVRTGPGGPAGFGGFTAVAPQRLFDSRTGSNQPLGPGGRLDLKVTGRAGVPASGVTAVVLDVTGFCASAASSFTVRPAGQTSAGPAALTFNADRAVRSTEVVVPVGAQGYVSLRNAQGVANARVDLVGYYSATGGAGFRPVVQATAYDSRTAGGKKPFGPTSARTVTVPTIAGVPASSVKAVLVNFSVYSPSGRGQLSAYAYRSARSSVASLAYGKTSTSGLATVRVSGGRFVLRNTGSTTHVLAQVVGVFTTAGGARYDELTPRRVWGAAEGSTVNATVRSKRLAGSGTAVPADAKAVVLKVTASRAASGTLVKVWAGDALSRAPKFPVLRLGRYATVTNTVVVPVLPSGLVSLQASSGSAGVNVQLLGYYR